MSSPSNQVPSAAVGEKPGLLLVGHGTRDIDGQVEFRTLGERLAEELSDWVVQPCCLEFSEPDIAAGLTELVRQGVTRVVAMPLLLLAAGHAKRDIPAWLAQATAPFPRIPWRLTTHLGCHAELIDLSVQRYSETLQRAAPLAAEETLLLLVGRGSTDPEANAEMAQFARLRWERAPTGWCEFCYTALAEPSLERGLEIAARLPFRRVVVQPHLLFAGRLLDRVRDAVDRRRTASPEKEWMVAEHLGPAPSLVRAVRQIVAQA